jgi:uncharacterized protein (TIGR02145 family)
VTSPFILSLYEWRAMKYLVYPLQSKIKLGVILKRRNLTMKMKNFSMLSIFLLILVLMCGKKNSTEPEENRPPACDMSGTWNIIITVTGGNRYSAGTKFTAVITLSQTKDGKATGSITTEGGLTSELNGTLSDVDFKFTIKQNLPCSGTFNGSGTITENYTKLSGDYSGDDCQGTLKASFASIIYIPYDSPSVTDIDGNTYRTVTIGSQVWMAENLRVKHYRNGDGIPNAIKTDQFGNNKTGAYCVYDNDGINALIYGNLYNWYAVNDSRNIAPQGWHVPTDDDWKVLEVFLGMDPSQADTIGYRGTDEGGKLKESGTIHWNVMNIGATNESGFTALPAGTVDPIARFYGLGNQTYFWSSSEQSSDYSYTRALTTFFSTIHRGYDYKGNGYSVRLVRD